MNGPGVRGALDVVVPTYDNVGELRRCLDALASEHQVGLRVLVCVDGSTDGTLEYLATATFPYRVLTLQHADGNNHGRSAARNLALAHLEAHHVLLLDSDMRLTPLALDRHIELLARHQGISVGEVVYENAAQNPWARYLGTRGHHKAIDGTEIRPLDFHTANVAMWTADLLEVGGFDETLVGYGGEDTELALRLAALGRTFIFNASARAMTVETKTVDEGLAQLRRFARTNLHAIRAKHPDAPAPFWIDRLESGRPRDRALRAMLNPVTDAVVDLTLPRAPFAVQRRLLDYKVIRNVFAGYREAAR